MGSSSSEALRFPFESSSIPVQDVEMEDSQPATQPIMGKATVQLPRHLPRPDYKEIRRETLAVIDPELSRAPTESIKQVLATLGPE